MPADHWREEAQREQAAVEAAWVRVGSISLHKEWCLKDIVQESQQLQLAHGVVPSTQCAIVALSADWVSFCCRVGAKCKTCKSTLHQPEAMYCQGCAYSKGICALCGSQILENLEKYKQSK